MVEYAREGDNYAEISRPMRGESARDSQMARVLARLGASSEKLSMSVEAIERRLDAVTRPSASDERLASVDNIDRSELVELPRAFFEYTTTIEAAIDRLESLLARCEL